jgi:hypothetical protein
MLITTKRTGIPKTSLETPITFYEKITGFWKN